MRKTREYGFKRFPHSLEEAFSLVRSVLQPDTLAFEKHVLGFFVAHLYSKNQFSVRLHFWPHRLIPLKPVWPIHTHRWMLKSLVLSGELENTTYELITGASNYRIYKVMYGERDSIRQAEDKLVRARIADRHTYGPGDQYIVAEGDFHSTRLIKGPALSLVQTGPEGLQPPYVLGDSSSKSEYRYKRSTIAKKEREEVIRHIRSVADLGVRRSLTSATSHTLN